MLVIEPQVAAVRDLNINEDDQSDGQFASNAWQVEAKLSHNFKCKCSFFKGSSCSSYFRLQQLVSLRMKHLEMDRDVLDMIILTHIRSHIHLSVQEGKFRLFARNIEWTISMNPKGSVGKHSCISMQCSKTR